MSEDRRRPWKDNGVSWIYFVDQIKDSDEFIYDEIDGNKFMFDCATGRLSIWSERWNAFADVGISSLLQCENGIKRKKIDEELQGVRIFYKGIELESRCIERNTELLECIDIKGELERSFINISRRGFTPEGERYFEEQLYPGLLEIVKRVFKKPVIAKGYVYLKYSNISSISSPIGIIALKHTPVINIPVQSHTVRAILTA